MALRFLGAPARAALERTLKIALALVLMVAVVTAVVGRHGRSAALLAAAEEEAAAEAAARAPAAAPAPRAPTTAARTDPPAPALLPSPPSGPPAAGTGAPLPPSEAPGVGPGETVAGGPQPGGSPDSTAAEKPMRLLPRPIAIDSGTFKVGAGTIRLIGVEPLSAGDTCGEAGTAWPCGMQARTALRGWLRARSISCAVPADFGSRQEILSAECRLGSTDIGLWLIENGWARADDAGRYTIVEKQARDARRGLWRDGGPTP